MRAGIAPKPFLTKALLETSIDLSQARDFDSIAEILFDFIEQIIPISMSVLYVLESDGQVLKPRACRGTRMDNLLKRNLFRLGEGGVGYVGREKQALLLTDAEKSTDLPIRIRQVKVEDPVIRSFLAVPLIVNNRLIGVLSASSSRPNHYSMHNVEIVSIVANQVAALVELYGRMEDTQRFSDHILENMNSGVIVTDNSGTIIMINRTGEEITGRKHNRLRGKAILKLDFIEKDTKWKIEQCLSEKMVLFEAPGTIIAKGGDKKHIRLSSSRLLTGKDRKRGYIIIFRDITQIEHLHEKLARFEKIIAFGKWTSCISHEIRNSLLPIRTSVQLLKGRIEQQLQDTNVRDLIGVLEEESERLNRFLNQLSDSRSLPVGQNNRTPLFVVLEETISLIRPRIEEKNIQLKISEPIPCWLPLSKDQVKQMLLNLFLNSIDALDAADGKREKLINIDVHAKDASTVINFIDNGVGIRKEDAEKVFEPFFTTKDKGSGLGLYNIHSLISSIGGKIKLESGVGKGTAVTLILQS